MRKTKGFSKSFQVGLSKLGFQDENDLYFVDSRNNLTDPEVIFHIETARFIHDEVSAVFLRKLLNGTHRPQIYLFDYTSKPFSEEIENNIAHIQRKIWSSGEVPLACFFFNTEIRIVDCTKHNTKELKPEYLVSQLRLTDQAHKIYNDQFAIKIKSGIFWEQDEVIRMFNFKNSAYDTLILNIREVTKKLSDKLKTSSTELINKIIIQSILIKYLEETSDEEGRRLLSERFFKKYDNSNSFSDVLIKGKFGQLLVDLNKNFNGNVFKWEAKEIKKLESLDLSILSILLATDKKNIDSIQIEVGFSDWRYFEFKYIPVELISRLYEEFLGIEKNEKGLFYTPAHLAKLLVDEALPLKKFKEIDVDNFLVFDPACGSGIFLVTVFKRLVQIWRLQNDLKKPSINVLKKILRNIYGVDKEEQALMLSSFSLSLALCNELKPIEVISKLKFDDLTQTNLTAIDFFLFDVGKKKFDLVIGNPPFNRGAISEYDNLWSVNNIKVKIPQGQIALKFLSESFSFLKNDGLVCLIIKSSGLLYNSTSYDYKRALFSNFNVIQVFDFTSLARNRSLWDNGADVASAAIFIRNNKPDFSRNILHVTFRRTKATKERLVFEIDDYDLHYINRNEAYSNDSIWKNNFLGGGRVKNLVSKVNNAPTLEDIVSQNNCLINEGYIVGNKGNLSPLFIYKMKTLPSHAINEEGINYSELEPVDKNIKFTKVPNEQAFKAPNLIIWEKIGDNRIPVFFNDRNFSFNHRVISISSAISDTKILKRIFNSINKYSDFYRFYIMACSSETLINRNNTFLLRDIKKLPFNLDKVEFSEIDKRIINETIEYMYDFLVHGEHSKVLKKIKPNNIESILTSFGNEFTRVMNSIYESEEKKFRLSDVVQMQGASLIATVFKYGNEDISPKFHNDFTALNIDGLTTNNISSFLSVKRVIKLYPAKDIIVFVKPNQYRYWLSNIAYRDADKCFADLSNITL